MKQIDIFQLVPFFDDRDKLYCYIFIALLWACSIAPFGTSLRKGGSFKGEETDELTQVKIRCERKADFVVLSSKLATYIRISQYPSPSGYVCLDWWPPKAEAAFC